MRTVTFTFTFKQELSPDLQKHAVQVASDYLKGKGVEMENDYHLIEVENVCQ